MTHADTYAQDMRDPLKEKFDIFKDRCWQGFNSSKDAGCTAKTRLEDAYWWLTLVDGQQLSWCVGAHSFSFTAVMCWTVFLAKVNDFQEKEKCAILTLFVRMKQTSHVLVSFRGTCRWVLLPLKATGFWKNSDQIIPEVSSRYQIILILWTMIKSVLSSQFN